VIASPVLLDPVEVVMRMKRPCCPNLRLLAAPALAALAGLASLAALGCGTRSGARAAGAPDAIALVVGEGVPPAAADRIERLLGESASSTLAEPLFQIERIPAARIGEAKSRRNVLLLANISTPGAGAVAVREALTPAEFGDAAGGVGVFFVHRDVWTRGQAVTILPGVNAQAVLSLVEERSHRIRDALVSAAKDLVAIDVYAAGEQKDAAAAGGGDWTIRVPARGWRLDRSRDAEGIVRIVQPDRGQEVTIAWAAADSAALTPAGALDLVDAIMARAGSRGVAGRDSVVAQQGLHAARRALHLSGAWVDGASTGPFETTLFVDPGSSRVYAVDRRVTEPGPHAKLRLWAVDAIAATFRLVEGHAPPG
jgi:hypothetical protein